MKIGMVLQPVHLGAGYDHISGKAAKDIGFNTADHALTPAFPANAAIARAFGYIIMNIGGMRPGLEDLSEMGHEFRQGFCMGDDPDTNPEAPAHGLWLCRGRLRRHHILAPGTPCIEGRHH